MNKDSSYQLIDCGEGRRLEKFGALLCDRPAPMALWQKKMSPQIWQQADLYYDRENKSWNRQAPQDWQVNIEGMVFNLETSNQSQTGVFPEQQANWLWLREHISSRLPAETNVLNCFAHTGGSTLACALAGAKVCHLDAAKSAVNRARQNAASCTIPEDAVRWIIDDAVKFMQREVKRGNYYNGIILDPPAFGRLGKNIWKLEKNLPQLLELAATLLSQKPAFLLLTCHPEGWNKQNMREAVSELFLRRIEKHRVTQADYGALEITSAQGNNLPLGLFSRLIF